MNDTAPNDSTLRYLISVQLEIKRAEWTFPVILIFFNAVLKTEIRKDLIKILKKSKRAE